MSEAGREDEGSRIIATASDSCIRKMIHLRCEQEERIDTLHHEDCAALAPAVLGRREGTKHLSPATADATISRVGPRRER
eukprot:271959-Rhodomonas_salina.1